MLFRLFFDHIIENIATFFTSSLSPKHFFCHFKNVYLQKEFLDKISTMLKACSWMKSLRLQIRSRLEWSLANRPCTWGIVGTGLFPVMTSTIFESDLVRVGLTCPWTTARWNGGRCPEHFAGPNWRARSWTHCSFEVKQICDSENGQMELSIQK